MAIGVGTAIALGAGASALSGILGAYGQNSANNANLQAVRETNEQNYKIWQEQKEYQTGERLATQEYNTPAAQRARYEAAGINPYFALGQMDAGNTQAMTSPSAPQMVPGQVQPVNYGAMFSEVGSSLANAATVESIGLDNESKKIDLTYKVSEKILSLEKQKAEIKNINMDTEVKWKMLSRIENEISQLQTTLDILRNTKGGIIEQNHLETVRKSLENESIRLANRLQQLTINMNPWQVKQLKASIAEAMSRVNLNSKNANVAVAEYSLKLAQKRGVDISNINQREYNMIVNDGIRLDNKMKKYGVDNPSYFEREILSPFSRYMNTVQNRFEAPQSLTPYDYTR